MKADGSLWAFGSNAFGQLGVAINAGVDMSNSTPMQVMTKVRAIAAGRYHSLVLKADGSLWTFGSNGSGELGRPLDVDTLATIYGQNPTLTQVMTGVRSIAAGGTHSLALKADGSLWGFGANGSGQLGATADYLSAFA